MTNATSVFVLLFAVTLVVNTAFRLFSMKDSVESRPRSPAFWQAAVAFVLGTAISLWLHAGILTALGVSIPLVVDALLTGIIVASGAENISSLHDLGGDGPSAIDASGKLDAGTIMNVTGTLRIIK